MTLAWVLAAMALLAPERDHLEVGLAVARVVTSEPPLFPGDADRRRTASLVIAVAWRESDLQNDARSATDDYCVMQIHRRPDLASDVEECVRVGLAMLRASIAACPSFPIAEYAEGPRGCSSARAQRISRDRIAIAHRLVREVTP